MTKQNKILSGLVAGILAITGTIYVINPGGDGGVFKPDCSQYKPGDTLDMRGNNYSYAYFQGLKGALNDSIVVIGGTLSRGFDFNNCEYVKVEKFTVDQNSYAVSAVAVSVHGKSSHMRFTDFSIINSGYGVWLKNEGDTSTSSWVLDGFRFDHFSMSNLFSHGFYAGATEYPNKSRPVTVNGVVLYPNPSMLGNIEISHGKITNVGRNGVMLCLAAYGSNSVHDMYIESTGHEKNQDQQGSGIQLGGYTKANVYKDTIKNTLLWGLRSFGGDTLIAENLIISNSGNNGDTTIKWAQNIAIGQDASWLSTGRKQYFSIKSNQLSTPGSSLVSNIQVWKGNFSDKNEVCSNTGNLSIETGITYSTSCSTPVPTPTPTKTIFKKGYWVINNKRFYYTVYTDSTWSNKK